MRLEIQEGDGAGGVIEVPPRGHFVLGRHPASDLKLRGKGVSRRHALLMVDGDEVAIQDLGSQNGTYVNGVRISGETKLGEGDKVRVGAQLLLRVSLSRAPLDGDAYERLAAPTPPTRIRPRKRALLELAEEAGPRCVVCAATMRPEGIASRSGFVRLDDGNLVCPACSGGLRSRKLVGGRYRVVGELGEGSVARVLRAIDEEVGRVVAVKLMKNELPKAALSYLEREIDVLRTLDHPCIVRLFDAATEGAERFIVMEHVGGTDLGSFVEKRGALAAPDAALVGFSVASGLALAHKRGIVHRDVKPSNVLLELDGRVKLADFGVARVTGTGGRLTKRGSRRGTPAYMAPEQARDPASAGPRADVYCVGATLYHAVSGAPPYGEGTPVGAILEKLDRGEPPAPFPMTVTSSSIGLADVIQKAMNPEVGERFADGAALRTALMDVLDLSAKLVVA
jgi:hypothetical protein